MVKIKISNINRDDDFVVNSKALTNFCVLNSSCIILTKRHSGGVPAGILHSMAEREVEIISKRLLRQLEFCKTISKKELKKIEVKDSKALERVFIKQAKEQKKTIEKMVKECSDCEDHLVENLKNNGLLKREYRFGSFFTWLDIWDYCFFDKDSVDYEMQEKNFFSYPIPIGEYELEDLGFVKDNHIWAKSCLHEEYLEMEMSQELYAKFNELEIPHYIM